MKTSLITVVLSLFTIVCLVANADYIPGATDVCEIEQAWTSIGTEPKGTFLDWRDMGGTDYMSPVEYQYSSGLCWAFASSHALTSQIKIVEGVGFSDNFSEDAIGDCSYPPGPSYGGSFWKAGAYFSARGPVLESCQGWNMGSTYCNPTCSQQDYRLTNLRTIASGVVAIKAALVNGPVVTSMDTSVITGFSSYNGTYVITTGASSSSDHSVMIVGYHEGTGDPGYLDGDYWICKNSWDSSWGDGGYFYIAYGIANIGNGNAQYWEWESSLESRNAELVYADEGGAGGYWSGMPFIIFACQRLVPTTDGQITQVQWANAGNNFTWVIQIYDNKSGSNLTVPLMTQLSNTNEPYGGILTVDLPSPVNVTAGNDVYVAIRMHNPTAGIHPCDVTGPASNEAYFSTTNINSSYSAALSADWGIRLTIEAGATPTPPVQTPTTGPAGIGILLVALGTLLTVFRKRK
ncbi:hypothetical protein K8T06_16995 [bacterium]|nr:hypothetical protein [bacterium]